MSMNYVLKLKTCPNNPAYSCVFEPPNLKLFEKSSLTPPLSLRILPLFEDSKIGLDVIDDSLCLLEWIWTSDLSVFDKI